MNPILFPFLASAALGDWVLEEVVPSGGTEPSGNRATPVFAKNGSGVFCLFGGRNSGSTDLTDLWTYNTGTNTWTQVSAALSGLGQIAIPCGYADGSGNLFISDQFRTFFNVSDNNVRKVNITTGAVTTVTSSGSPASSTQPPITVNIPTKRVYGAEAASGANGYRTANNMHWAEQDPSMNTNAVTRLTSTLGSRFIYAGPAYWPSENALFALAPSINYNANYYTLAATDIVRYNIASSTAWDSETGVINQVVGLTMPGPGLMGGPAEMLWCATEAKFFIFVPAESVTGKLHRVLTYDPATKILGEVSFSGTADYILNGDKIYQRGNCGQVVEDSGSFYFIRCYNSPPVTNARIWKFRKVVN